MEGNIQHVVAPSFQSSSSPSFDSINSMSTLKIYGLRKQNYFKKFRKDIIQLTNYIFWISPPLNSIHNIMSAIRIIQFLLPCFIPNYFNFWKVGSVDQVTMNVLAVIYYLLPPSSLFKAAHILLIIYIIIQLLVTIIVILSSFYFKKNAKLPISVAIFIYVYHSTFGHYLHPIIIYTIFEGISYAVSPNAHIQISITSFSVLVAISFICVLFNFFFMTIISSQTLVYRPNSLASVTSSTQFFIFLITILINLFFGIGTYFEKKYQIIFLSFNVILYAITSFSVFTRGGFVQTIISNAVLSSSITGAVFTLLDIVFIVLDKHGSVALTFAFIVFFVLILIINFFILQHSQMNQLKLLDAIQEDHSLFSLVKSSNHFLQLATRGIKFAHPIIMDLTFFDLGVTRWNHNPYIYFVYAKFIAIYPEETVTLKYIYRSVKLLKFSDSTTRCIKEQTNTILKQRDFGLSSELRNKINRLRKQIQSTKHKLGYVWDVIIRGNLNDIETASKRAISSINETNTDFKHLLHEYPNNRNVTYTYSGFLNDVMADHIASEEMHERTKLLLPGLSVIEDQTHEYGLKMFINLPSTLRTKQDHNLPMMSSTVEPQQLTPSCLNMEREKQKDLDQISGIMTNIEELTIPSILYSKIVIIFSFLFLFFIPCICGLIYVNFFIKKLQQPLRFISSLSILRAYAYQVIGFSLRYVGENMTVFNKIDIKDHPPPKHFGDSWDTRTQLEYILIKTTTALEEFGSFRMFEEDNHYINQAQSLIFQNTVPYKYYTSPTNITTSMISISAAILDYTIQQKMILSGYGATDSVLSSGTILNPINNAYSITVNIHNALQLMIDYISENHEKTKRIGQILIISVIVIECVLNIIFLVSEAKWIKSNKIETYQCLFSLPKNIVSELAENRDSKKRDNPTEEMNKQDENIMKIFNSGGNSERLFSDLSLLIIGTFLIVIISIVCIILFRYLYVDLTRIVRNSAPHLHYLLASYSMMLSSINWLHVLLFEFAGHPIPTVDFNFSVGRMEYVMEKSRHFYHLISAGGPSNKEVPFPGFMQGVRDSSPRNCSISNHNKNYLIMQIKDILDNFQKTKSKTILASGFNSLTKILECAPVDMTFTLIEPIISYSILPYQRGFVPDIDPKSPSYETIWIQLISPLYDLFFQPLHDQIIPSIIENLKNKKNQYIPVIVSLLILAFVFEVILFAQVKIIENHIKSVLKFLLHCSPSTIFQSSKITRVLAGDFSPQQSDSLDKNNSFFDTVFTSLPDAIMYANMTDMIIQNANKACEQIFGDVDIVGRSIRNFFTSDKFMGNIESLFTSVKTNPTEEIAFKREAESELIFKATSMIACGKFVISLKNVTQSHNYNNLILEEKQNSDRLLSTILPPSLVTRVQEGEKNISFSVQSASILFSDIVEFTPWCGSLPPEKVMYTLNILFKRFDSILDTKRTMTKIKCIGDCYMAAGGIFSEINQPAVHAEEVVSFGLLSIKEILKINKEINQNLKIRVGVNTGGPVVAGVLGIGKPTFEILGPAINRAQQMEQNGFPLMVHISIDVYKLICGLNFKFCNQRTIDCKNEKVETYLVEP